MIKVAATENLTGVTIQGDHDDLYQLVEAFHLITIDEYSEKHAWYAPMSIRVLGLCYDVRHAMMGDRGLELIDNGMNEDKMKFHAVITPSSNVYYSCNCLIPELIYIMLALNELVELRIKNLSNSKMLFQREYSHKDVIWDEVLATIRLFQSKVNACVKGILSEATYSRWIKAMNEDYIHPEQMARQYLDILNIDYIGMTREKRLKDFNKWTRRITQYSQDREHIHIDKMVRNAAIEHRCAKGDISLVGVEYPENWDW